MSDYYDEIEIEDMDFNPTKQIYTYPCPCGDIFRISLEEMWEFGEDVANCPSCTLQILVIYDDDDLPELEGFDDDSEDGDDAEGVDNDQEKLAVQLKKLEVSWRLVSKNTLQNSKVTQ